ncbi:MAG: aminotransferase class III-fold pyridoxal phosphate-dependent enzyme [Armatimonadota bacterium]|nr:aminotransferase class III-fold pyridoxal phosphate-dependent enzyme [Armatimonadota bacterium]
MELPDITRSLELYDRALQIIPGGTQLFSRRPERFAPGVCPPYVTRAKGTRVWDLDGNEYIDFLCGVGPVILGHAYDRVTEAVVEQVRKGSAFSVNHPLEAELAELLVEIVPCAEMVRFCKAGGTADEMAVRIARGHTGRDKVVFCGYHGWHDWYLSANLGDDETLDGHLLPGLDIRGVPRALRGTAVPFEYNDLDSLRSALEANRGDVAAIIMEPSRTDLPQPGFLERVREQADAHGAVLIFDEVITGFRLALGGAQEMYGVIPDMATYGKAMSNGHPIAAVCGRREVMQDAATMFISSTYYSDAAGMAAALATIRELRDTNALEHIREMGRMLIDGFAELAERHSVPAALLGPPPCTHPHFDCPGDLSKDIMTLYLQEMYRGRVLACTVNYICYQHSPEDIQAFLDAADGALAVVRQALDEGDASAYLEADRRGDDLPRIVR